MSSTASTSAVPGPTTTPDPQQGTNPSSPLLFFVALGFGVVFTNLWIIVGVKYCFRYNQRNRARLAGEDPDGVDLNAMPRQRRRREKKLMTIDEVNERFPLVKYKTWRSTRADQGLPTAGGITNGPSRPVSVRHEPRDSHDDVDLRDKEPKTPTTFVMSEKTTTPEHGTAQEIETAPTTSAEPSDPAQSTIKAPEPALVRATSNEEDQERTDQIQTAIPPEHLPDPGDTCAICIDTIEDDDDIRGLSCGHAFHASCVDPWLTSRRACCPLCKADYYVPKPRPEVQEEARRNSRAEQPISGPFAIIGPGHRYRRQMPFNLPGVFIGSPQPGMGRSRSNAQEQSLSTIPTNAPEVQGTEQTPQNSQSWRQRIRMPAVPALSRIRRGRGNETGEQPVETPNPTPAQLEAGRS